jgi:hypothetical protein
MDARRQQFFDELREQPEVLGLVELFFDVERLWAPPPKKALQLIRKTNPRLGRLLDLFYAPPSTLEKRISLAEEMIREILGDQ